MGEQSTKEKDQKIENIIAGLTEISRKIEGEGARTQPRFTYNDSAEADVKPDSKEKSEENSKLKAGTADCLQVKVYEDIDIKDVLNP